ncbi:MAG: hypothetical protein HPY53_01300 [Brevinematales bacterium]|nr:hypothetical protein [Brevinematales bacterium]
MKSKFTKVVLAVIALFPLVACSTGEEVKPNYKPNDLKMGNYTKQGDPWTGMYYEYQAYQKKTADTDKNVKYDIDIEEYNAKKMMYSGFDDDITMKITNIIIFVTNKTVTTNKGGKISEDIKISVQTNKIFVDDPSKKKKDNQKGGFVMSESVPDIAYPLLDNTMLLEVFIPKKVFPDVVEGPKIEYLKVKTTRFSKINSYTGDYSKIKE